MNRAQNSGTTVMAKRYDAKIESTTPSARSVNRYLLTPKKKLTGKNTIEVVEVAAKSVTACTFGGADLDELYITTSQNLDDGNPAAGALFRYLPGVCGLPTLPFAG